MNQCRLHDSVLFCAIIFILTDKLQTVSSISKQYGEGGRFAASERRTVRVIAGISNANVRGTHARAQKTYIPYYFMYSIHSMRPYSQYCVESVLQFCLDYSHFLLPFFCFVCFGHIRRIRSRRPCATQKLIKTRHLDRCIIPVLTKTYK